MDSVMLLQRVVDQTMDVVDATATGISVSVPTQPNLTPPGWYLLFVVDAAGVPSVA